MKKLDTSEIEALLDDFDYSIREKNLLELSKTLTLHQYNNNNTSTTKWTNMHYHTFYSFNAYGYSPQHIAWRAKKEHLAVIGTVDFDVLDNMEETLTAGEILSMKTAAGFETRCYIGEYKDKVINSPGEPGICYFIGIGFYKKPSPGTKYAEVLSNLFNIAKQRNLMIIEKVNEFLTPVKIDYQKDILPLTPKGNATERHILYGYWNKSKEVFKNNIDEVVRFWATKLNTNYETISKLVADLPEFIEFARAKLMKYGSIGYVSPTPYMFPKLEDVIEMITSCDALPAYAWLDGTTPAECNIAELLNFMVEKGIALVNIILDRNWNIKNAEEKKIKVEKLNELIKTCKELSLPIIAGTEMNKYGQKFVDDFHAPELKNYVDELYKGACFVYGHTLLGRYAGGKGYNSPWAKKYFPSTHYIAHKEKKDFYTTIGEKFMPSKDNFSLLMSLKDENITPEEIKNKIERR
jgi:hypothetical protein